MTALRPTVHVRAAAAGSAAAIAVFVFIQQAAGAILQALPGIFVPLAIVWDLSLWLWAIGVAVTVYAATSPTGLRRTARAGSVARGAACVALIAPALLGYGQFTGSFATLVPIAYLVIFVSAGVAMVAASIDAGRSGATSRSHAALGASTGVAYVIGGLGSLGFLGTPVLVTLAAIGLQVLMLAHALYLAWALWLAARPGHARAPELAPA